MPTMLGDSVKYVQGLILGLPEILPCQPCRKHARAFIDAHKPLIMAIKTRSELFEFLVDFHNHVNLQQGKAVLDYNTAWDMYSQGGNVNVLTYL